MTEALAREIWSHRDTSADRSLDWLGPRMPSLNEAFRMMPIGPYFYSGAAGISFFFAALHNILGYQIYREQSLEAIAGIRVKMRKIVRSGEKAENLSLGIGGTFGLGSLIYCFVRIGEFAEEPELIEEAHQLSNLLSSARIANDKFLDIVLGSAGAVLALLALHEVCPRPNQRGATPLDLACECARQLICRRTSFESRPLAWATMEGHPPLSGFSHGAAGICYALLRLYEKTGWAELLDVAKEGLSFERSVYSPRYRNWRDMRVRDVARPRFLTNWCHGAPGIALARLGALHVMDGPEIREEIRAALETTEDLEQTQLDYLCCGNMGRVDILAYASRKLSDPRWLEAALDLTDRVLRRAWRNGHFGWLPETEIYQFDPSFFTGAAGVGYALLCLAIPDRLPCTLLLE